MKTSIQTPPLKALVFSILTILSLPVIADRWEYVTNSHKAEHILKYGGGDVESKFVCKEDGTLYSTHKHKGLGLKVTMAAEKSNTAGRIQRMLGELNTESKVEVPISAPSTVVLDHAVRDLYFYKFYCPDRRGLGAYSFRTEKDCSWVNDVGVINESHGARLGELELERITGPYNLTYEDCFWHGPDFIGGYKYGGKSACKQDQVLARSHGHEFADQYPDWKHQCGIFGVDVSGWPD